MHVVYNHNRVQGSKALRGSEGEADRKRVREREYSQEIWTTEQLRVRASMVAHRDKERERGRESVQIVEMTIRENGRRESRRQG